MGRTEQNTNTGDTFKLDADTETVTIRYMRNGKAVAGTCVTWEQLRKLYLDAKAETLTSP